MKTLQIFVIGLIAILFVGTATASAATSKPAVLGQNAKAEKLRVGMQFQAFEFGKPQQETTRYKRQKPKIKRISVKVFLVAVGDNGKMGCEDSLVAITRSVKPTAAILKSAVQELLNLPRNYNGKLENFWGGSNLKIKSVTLKKGIATIRLTGDGPMIGGVCDEPRITLQIEETAKQFSTVKRVKIFVNNQTLAQVIK